MTSGPTKRIFVLRPFSAMNTIARMATMAPTTCWGVGRLFCCWSVSWLGMDCVYRVGALIILTRGGGLVVRSYG